MCVVNLSGCASGGAGDIEKATSFIKMSLDGMYADGSPVIQVGGNVNIETYIDVQTVSA